MSNQHEFINLSYLQSIAGDDKSIIRELITIFLEQIPEFTEGLDKSFEEEDWRNVAAIAHKAKSSVLSMGMEELGNTDLKNLELIAKAFFVQTVNNKPEATEKEVKEARTLEKNLKGYDEERQNWVKENNTPQKMAAIIDKFKTVLKKAETELETEIKE
ncbi:Hpt domain-containing protein [Marinilabilia sp.]|uniref:Hpt domain-containing protein n=1 Tax=Marinilabilia sp. TaxID=2021252 RepID=UPI0025BEEC88|nr:Hpt domain-containing protein [Marinilabilia sp.]